MIASLITALFLAGVMTTSGAATFLYITGALLILTELTSLTTFGILAFNGTLALATGYMIDTGSNSLFGLPVGWSFFFGLAFVELLIIITCVFVVLRSRKIKVTTGLEAMIGENAEVLEWDDQKGRVRIHGEDWNATSDQTIKTGDLVVIQNIHNLTLTVSKGD